MALPRILFLIMVSDVGFPVYDFVFNSQLKLGMDPRNITSLYAQR